MTETIPVPKKAFLSKSIWTGLMIAIVNVMIAFFPDAKQYVNVEMVNMLFGFIVMIMRMVTKGSVVLW